MAVRRPEVSLRQRKRAATIEEIKSVALAQLADEGGAMTLRGVAREVGMTVQSLYHYFPSRDDLITALVVDAHDALADAVELARSEAGGGDLVRLAVAYRAWAVEHRARFLLIYGTPIPGYQAPDPGPTTEAARRLGAAFIDTVFAGWSRDDIERVRVPKDDRRLSATLSAAAALVAPSLPPGAFGLFLELWSRMHGIVILEVLNHLPWLTQAETAAAYYESAMTRVAADLDRIRRGLPDDGPTRPGAV